jgi:enoyl-CoA hydratase/carnithine racemase
MIFLTHAELEATDMEAITSHHELRIAFVAGPLQGHALAVALHCDWLAIGENATLVIDSPQAWSGAIGRIGARPAYLLHLFGRTTLNAGDAVTHGLADALVPFGADPVEWLAGWIGGRSTRALDEAAALIRGRGGDVTERLAFARLFATGEPQRGLAAFLEKRRPDWNREMDLI